MTGRSEAWRSNFRAPLIASSSSTTRMLLDFWISRARTIGGRLPCLLRTRQVAPRVQRQVLGPKRTVEISPDSSLYPWVQHVNATAWSPGSQRLPVAEWVVASAEAI